MKTPCNAKRITGSFHSCGYMFYSSLSKLSETSKFLLVIIALCVYFNKNWSKNVDVAFHFFFQILINRCKNEGYWGVVPQIKMYHFLYVASGK